MTVDELRIGHGFDVHPFADPESTKPLVLGGVVFEDAIGLVGHSDADVIAHACTDAVLGATGHDDIGAMFPDDDETLAGADSVEMLRAAVSAVVEAGWAIVNVDCTVVLDAPKIAPHRAEMQRRLSDAVGAPVTVKGKRTEGLEGLSGGIQGFAVALARRSRRDGGER